MTWNTVSRRTIFVAFQIILGSLTLLWVLTQPDWQAVFDGLRLLSPLLISAIIVTSIAGIFASFYTWVALIRRYQWVDLWTGGRIDLSVSFVNQILPSRLSGRVAAPIAVQRCTEIDWNKAVAVAIAHTGLFALIYGFVSLAGVLFGAVLFSSEIVVLLLLSTGLYFLAGIGILGAASRLDRTVPTWINKLQTTPVIGGVWSRVSSHLLDFPLEIAAVGPLVRELVLDRRTLLSYGLAWLIALGIAPGIRFWLLFQGMGTSFTPLIGLPLFVVAAYSVTLLPLTPGGIGVTEATATVVFVSLGVPSSIAVPVVLIDRFLGVYLPALCGWYPTMSLGLDELDDR